MTSHKVTGYKVTKLRGFRAANLEQAEGSEGDSEEAEQRQQQSRGPLVGGPVQALSHVSCKL